MAQNLALEDQSGAAVTLGAELGRGGEGAVFDVQGRPHHAAKLYHTPPTPDHAAKLAAMVASGDERLTRIAAWPTTTLQARHGRAVGFLMPKVAGFRPAFDLYLLRPRLQQFPKADWRFLVRAAANAARSFAVVHAAGHVIGDVNHGNLVVGQDATVRLIDCDSFQIRGRDRTWFCDVGVPTHQAPEMQGMASYAGFTRTANHDAFGLAVIIFQMLCLARHPYSGRFLGSGEPPSMEEAIKGFRYAYAADTRATLLTPPPGSLPMEALNPQVRELFERAFLRGGAQPGGRPTPGQWVAALDGLAQDLRPCQAATTHHYSRSLSRCPWCDLEAKTSIAFFPATFIPATAGTDGFLALWQQVLAEPQLGPRPRMPAPPTPAPSEAATRTARKARTVVLLASLVLLAGWCWIWGDADPTSRTGYMVALPTLLAVVVAPMLAASGHETKREMAMAAAQWTVLRARWSTLPADQDPARLRADLDQHKRDYDAVQAARVAKLKGLHDDRRAGQLVAHLDRFQIAAAKLKGVGHAKAAVLQSHGIETAADVVAHKVLAVPGFGPKTTQHLLEWRAAVERSFRFDPSKLPDPQKVGLVEHAASQQTRTLELRLSAGLSSLRAAARREAALRNDLRVQFDRVAPRYGQAVADRRAATLHF